MRAALRTLAAIIAASCITFGAAAGQSARVEGVYLSSVQFGTSLSFEFYVLFKDGRAFNGVPAGGPEALDLAAAEKADPTKVGTWKESGGNVTVAWGGGRGASVFPRRADGSLDLKRGVSTRLVPLPDGQKLAGRYSRMATASGAGGMVSSSKSIVFQPDGSYKGTMVGAVATRDAGGKAVERADEGSYAIRGYSITFNGGAGQLLATYKNESPDSPGIIFLGGGYMMRK